METSTHPEKSKSQIRPRRIRKLRAALGTALDANKHPLIARHWEFPTRQTILRQLAKAEREFQHPANDNISVTWPKGVRYD